MIASVLLLASGCVKADMWNSEAVQPAASPATESPQLHTSQLVNTLRQGGYVIYIRHTATDWSQADIREGGEWWKNCEAHRNLSPEGRVQAQVIGDALRTLGIPIGQVIASEYCRTVETAQLMKVGSVQTTNRLNGRRSWQNLNGKSGQEQLVAETRILLGTPPAPGVNKVLVSHIHNFKEPAHPVLSEIAEGEAAIFKPSDDGSFTLIARVTSTKWVELTQNSVSTAKAKSLLKQQTSLNPSQVTRKDFYVTSDPGIQIFVREVLLGDRTKSSNPPILLIHGGGPGGITSFDLNVRGYSLAADFAAAGHSVYIMNVRGWEHSTRPTALDQPPEKNPPSVPSDEAVRDIGDVVDAIRDRHQGQPVALVGWATGGHWAGMYTSQNNEKVSHLVMLNSLYGVDAPWKLRHAFEDPNKPGTFDSDAGAYRITDAEGLITQWNRTIPVEDKSQWRDPAVVDAYQRTALARGANGNTSNPSSLRIPSAYRLESYNLSLGQKYWEASDITVPTLVIRGELDFWSRQEDLQALKAELVNASRVKTVTIPSGTHYLFNDRPERGRDFFIRQVLSFLRNNAD
ncbi:alpha/beta fold hydrolase [Nostocales cyanobacterium LEGE 11386]|nr:alpha/beta fold hydrolase [Nostocales cyanobacterium LEGE 11386]